MDETLDTLSDSDVEDEAANNISSLFSSTTSRDDPPVNVGQKIQPDIHFEQGAPALNPAESETERFVDSADSVLSDEEAETRSQSMAEGDDDMGEESHEAAPRMPVRRISRKRLRDRDGAAVIGPKKTRVVIKDAAWSTWWAILYWVGVDSVIMT